jgi:hypothetical protein
MRHAPYPAHDEAPEVVGAATITATCVRHGRKWRVLIRRPTPPESPASSPRTKMPSTSCTTSTAWVWPAWIWLKHSPRPGPRPTEDYLALREALPAFLDEQVRLRNLRESTARAYKNRLST